MLEIAIE